ncbi:MAG: translation initiation factor IF-2 [Clostridiales bacterium]|nr:translation initiation factor IF-2 [Clostridiales bacterium]
MSKMKIHELAKELNVGSNDIVDFLQHNGSDVKSYRNSIDEDEITLVRNRFKGSQQTAAGQPAKTEAPKKASEGNKERATTAQGERKHMSEQGLSSVGKTADNSNDTMKPMQDQAVNVENKANVAGQNNGDKKTSNNTGDRRTNNNTMGERKPLGDRPQGQNNSERKPFNNNGERRPYGDRPQGQYNNSERRPYGDRPQGQNNGERRPYGDRPQGQNNGERRPFNNNGERRPYGDRPQGQYNNGERRPYGDRPQGQNNGERRPYGDRPQGQYNNGERRPFNNNGERRPYGDRPQGQNNGERRPYGDRPQGQGSYGQRPQGQGGYGQRPQGQGGFGQRTGGFNGGGQRSGGFNGGGFDKDKDAGYNNNRSFGSKRNDARNAEKSSIKSDLANELTKEQRAAAFNDRNRDKNRGRRSDRDGDESKLTKPKKDPNRKGAFIKPQPVVVETPKEDEIKTITIPEVVTIKELADKMKVVPSVVVKKLFLAGKMVSINSEITFEEAEEIGLEYNCIVEKEVVVDQVEELLKEDEEDESLMVKRPPVVCVMGHVDHGKTSLLDAIRATHVTAKEAGGITQHIGAYQVEINGEVITFLDTPGHEAFTSMRMRGAQSTDIAILVVAADDGVMPQTVEAISHAKAAGVQIIVAVNKMDKPGANLERVKQELTEYELVAEDWGGDTIFVPVSAHTKEGIPQLLEMIVLTADILELKANPNRKARGIVIEAELDKGRGTVATILVQKGTLRVGDNIAIGAAYGKVRAMMDDKGRRVKEALPSTPVEILGLNAVPNAGETFIATENEKEARTISEAFIFQGRERLLADTKAKLSLDSLFSQIKEGEIKELNIIIKADVQGSVEAVKQSLVKLSNEEVAVRVIHGGVGAINESDVTLASTSNAIIIGFNVRPDNMARETAEREKVDMRLYRVIYNAIEDVEAAMKGMLDPKFEEQVIGHAEVRATFKASGVGTIAGSYVLDGKAVRGCSARITRDGNQIFDGPLASLKRVKDDVKEVAKGFECGIVFEKFNDLQEFDQIEFYMMVEVPR